MGTATGTLGCTTLLKSEFTENVVENIIENKDTQYILLEHIENNNLLTEFYKKDQEEEKIVHIGTETERKPWYKRIFGL